MTARELVKTLENGTDNKEYVFTFWTLKRRVNGARAHVHKATVGKIDGIELEALIEEALVDVRRRGHILQIATFPRRPDVVRVFERGRNFHRNQTDAVKARDGQTIAVIE